MANTIIESIQKYLCTCPLLGESKINVDYLPDKGCEYSVDTIPGSGTVKTYTSGASVEKYLFVIRANREYGSDVLQQMQNSGLFEEIKDWLKKQSSVQNLPKLPQGSSPQKIEALNGGGYLTNATAHTGTYQIQCVLTYYKEKE